MEYLQLLHHLRENKYHYQSYGNLDLNLDLIYARILTDRTLPYTTSTLYIAPADLLPEPDMGSPAVIFYLGGPLNPDAYKDSMFQIVTFEPDISPGQLMNLVLECLTEIQQITAGMHILVNALFSGNGLQYLVDTATNLFGNPIYVIDLQHKYLAMSAGIVPDNIFFNEERSTGYISTAGIQYIAKKNLNEKIRDCRHAYYHYNELIEKAMLIDVVEIQGIEIGHVMMLESEHAFHDFDKEFFHRFSKLISMELQKDSAFRRNKGVMYSYFLADLIKHPSKDTNEIRNRLHAMGYHLKETFYIIVIPSVGTTSDLKREVILERLRYILSGSIYVIYENTIVFLISRDMDQHLNDYEMKQLETYLTANGLKAGISNFFRNLEDTALFYQQAVSSVLLGVKLKDSSSIYYFRDYYLYEMLESYELQSPPPMSSAIHYGKKTKSRLQFLIQPGLMKLYLYDKDHGTDFIDTLIEFLRTPGQPSIIAETLHIHKNTLLYRMGKIRQITGCDFAEGEEYMNYNLSIKIMKYLQMI
jgi:sugar diacid utilization regulator